MPLHIDLFFNNRFLTSFSTLFHFNLVVLNLLHLELLDLADIVDFVVSVCLYLLVQSSVLDLVLSHLGNQLLPVL